MLRSPERLPVPHGGVQIFVVRLFVGGLEGGVGEREGVGVRLSPRARGMLPIFRPQECGTNIAPVVYCGPATAHTLSLCSFRTSIEGDCPHRA
jgi:hypothetical protein